MWRIIKQNIRFSVFYLMTAFLAVVALRLLTESAISTVFVVFCGLLMYILVFGLIFVSEQYEEKHHGYIFLSSLPINVREIVMAKFFRVLVAEVLLMGFILIFIYLSPGSTHQLVVARSWILFNGLLALLLGGLVFLGFFSTSYTTFLRVSLVFLVFLQLIPMLILNSGRMKEYIESTVAFLSSINWVVWIPLGLFAYFGLMLGAAKIKSLNRC